MAENASCVTFHSFGPERTFTQVVISFRVPRYAMVVGSALFLGVLDFPYQLSFCVVFPKEANTNFLNQC